MHPIRIAPTSSQADEWALVLTAAGIPSVVEPDALGGAVRAAADDRARAHAVLAAYDEERRVETAPAEILKSLVEQSRIGATLLPRFGSVEEIVRPLVAVWGGDEEDFAAAA